MESTPVKLKSNEEWVEQQFGQCELGNRSRTKRLQKIVQAMVSCPEKSLSFQNSDWADLKAAYRLFDTETVTFDAVAEQHWKLTRQTAAGRYLLISDTTDVDHTKRKKTTGLGMLGDGKGRGFQLHSCLVYNSDQKLIVGMAGGLVHYRKAVSKGEKRMERLQRARESEIWGNLVDKVGAAPEGCQWIHVFDRGGDNFEAMCHIRLTGCDWIIRAAKLQRNVITESREKLSLKKALSSARPLGSYELWLRSRPGVKARTAQLDVFVLKVVLPKPQPCSKWVKQCGLDEIPLNVVIVKEKKAPKDVEPIQWILFTSLPVETFKDAWQVIDDYENRWLIEEYHKVIKTGCSLEKHTLRKAERLEPLTGLICVIGIRLLQMKLVGRSQKEAKARTHVPSTWIKALKLLKPTVAVTDMTVYEFFRELAKLGGFLGRKSDGEPGWQTTWLGYQKLHTMLDAMTIAGAI
jgi:hypothetical protein